MAIPVSGADTWLTLNDVPLSFRPGSENLDARAVEYGRNRLRVMPNAPDDLEIHVDDELLETEVYGRWTWRPAGFAGLYQLQVSAKNIAPQTTLVRVLPSKLSLERYVRMLDDVSKIAVDLLFTLHSPASEKAAFKSLRRRPSALREYALIRPIVRDLGNVIEQIRRNPYRTLTEQTESRLLHQVHRFSSDLVPVSGPMLALPEAMSSSLGVGFLPQGWTVQTNTLTYDVYENRLLKHFLWRQLLTRLGVIKEKARNEISRREQERQIKLCQGWEDDESAQIKKLEAVVQECQSMTRRCIGWGSEPFLRTVGALNLNSRPTQVLQKHPYYSRFYRLYLRFQQELGLGLDTDRYVTRLALRKMSELYQFWSVFQITRLVLDKLGRIGYRTASSHGFFQVSEDEFTLQVERGAAIELRKEDRQVIIRYEPVYPPAKQVKSGLMGGVTFQLTPDLAIEVWEEGRVSQVIVFDAKYHSQPDGESQTYLEEDREKMDHYFNTIRWKSADPTQRLRRVVSSAYILYPGDVLDHDPDEPEVGALPLVPRVKQPQTVEQTVEQILRFAYLL